MKTRRVCVIGCCGPKLAAPAPAREVYISHLFRLSLKWAQIQHFDRICIVSAKLGIVHLDQLIKPYDATLPPERTREFHDWEHWVRKSFCERLETQVVALAGRRYASVFSWWELVQPLAGMSIGQRLRWLKGQIAAAERAREA